MYSNIENIIDITFISFSHIWKRTEITYIYIPTLIMELIELLLLFQQKIGTYICIPTKTRNFQSPTYMVKPILCFLRGKGHQLDGLDGRFYKSS